MMREQTQREIDIELLRKAYTKFKIASSRAGRVYDETIAPFKTAYNEATNDAEDALGEAMGKAGKEFNDVKDKYDYDLLEELGMD